MYTCAEGQIHASSWECCKRLEVMVYSLHLDQGQGESQDWIIRLTAWIIFHENLQYESKVTWKWWVGLREVRGGVSLWGL